MSEMKQYVEDVLALVKQRDPDQPEFYNTVREVFASIVPYLEKNPQFKAQKMLERMIEPDRIITFRVVWQDDKGRNSYQSRLSCSNEFGYWSVQRRLAFPSQRKSQHFEVFSI